MTNEAVAYFSQPFHFTKDDLHTLRVTDKPLMLIDYGGMSWLINRSVNGYTVSQYHTEDGYIVSQKTFFELAEAEQLVLEQFNGTVKAMQ